MGKYQKHTWADGEEITDDKLNNIEEGIAEAKKEAENATMAQNDAKALRVDLEEHKTSTEAHADLRLELKEISDRINAVLDSDDATLDELSEIVAYIKSNKSLIDAITTSKVSVSDIINNLTTNVTNKPLSAAQGVAIKALIDALQTAVNGKAASSHNQPASTITAGTFAGQVAASASGQSPSVSCLRNSKFSFDESDVPTVEGETVWYLG